MSLNSGSSNNPADKEKPNTVAILLNKIRESVLAGKFLEAEKLRDELIDKEPMAISEAIRAAELIEQHMSDTIDKNHLAKWPELYENLTVEERNCLYHSMKSYTLPANKILLRYGSLNNRLFFIESGKVAVGLPQDDKKLKVIAQLGRGDVLGEYTFATISLCSATAVTTNEVELRCLDGKDAENWDEKHPGLYEKLINYCLKFGRVDQIEKRKEAQKRSHPRYPVKGGVNAVLLDKSGEKTNINFRGEVEEISRSGTSFTIHVKKKTVVKKLLTRLLALEFSCNHDGKEIRFSSFGKVIRVSFLLYSDYLLHISFPEKLPEELISKFQT